MLNLNPDKRATAQQMLADKWLDGVIVQGAFFWPFCIWRLVTLGPVRRRD